jgi:hypothetical protein
LVGELAARFIRREIAFGLVNGSAVSIHHDASRVRFFPVGFIFDERRARMVNRASSSDGPSPTAACSA